MNPAQLINQTSGDVEIYTPEKIINAARKAMGGDIHLDPASSREANVTVMAERFFTKEDDGLSKRWACGTLWMNHPFSRKDNARWINKLLDSYNRGDIWESACCITFASTSEEWFRPLLELPQCYLWPRTNYMRPDGSIYRGVTKGSVVTYMGNDLARFRSAFAGLGTVKV